MSKMISCEEFLQSIEQDIVVDMNNPTCSKCNDCCGLGTLLSDSEFKRLTDFLKYNPKGNIIHRKAIRNFKEYLEKGIVYAICPFTDTNTKKCKIYNDRPSICVEFHCNKEINKCNIKDYRGNYKYSIAELFFGVRRNK